MKGQGDARAERGHGDGRRSADREWAVPRRGGRWPEPADCAAELCHEARATLLGIEAAATGLARHSDRLTVEQHEGQAHGLLAEVRRLRGLLEGRVVPSATFDVGAAISPVITCARAGGLEVRSSVARGIEVI